MPKSHRYLPISTGLERDNFQRSIERRSLIFLRLNRVQYRGEDVSIV
ncbi:MAG: hypothetical protein J7641_01590 [Cyanobacteria bacterium SID2]|nr:hypothetical protein [Cyanobacteria bacterium SID2]MBP0004399.1 hypothetical protein [Cyanobacteria bacterium SBC]